MSLSLLISLVFFLIFKSYAAALTAAFGLNPLAVPYNVSTVLTNISANADTLNANVGAPLFNPSGNDFDLNLFQMGLQFSSNYTPNNMSPLLSVDGLRVQGMGGIVLSAEVGATSVLRITDPSTGADPQMARLLLANYGTNVLRFTASGVGASTRCAMTEQYMTSQAEFYSNLFTIFNISTPSCGQISRVHSADLDVVYDAYVCLDLSTIITGIIRTSPSNATLAEAMEYSTTLSDALGSGVYAEKSNAFHLNPGTFETTLMIPSGVLEVLKFTFAGWIQTMGRRGSQGLLAFIDSTPLDDSTMTSMMEDAISYLYAVGGAKVVSTANVKTVFRGAASPFTTRNTTVEIVADVFQIGYGKYGAHKYFIVFLALNAALALACVICMFRFPPMPLDPTEPLSMVLLALNSP